MAEHDDGRLVRVVGALASAEDIIRLILAALPIPVKIASLFTETGPDVTAIIALDRTRDLIDEEPLSDVAKLAHCDLILEWLTAYEMIVLWKLAGPAPWRLTIAETALSRLAALAEMIGEGDYGPFED